MYIYIYASLLTCSCDFPQERVREQRLSSLAEHSAADTTASQGSLSVFSYNTYNALYSAKLREIVEEGEVGEVEEEKSCPEQ